MKISGIVPDFHHKNCTRYMSRLLEVLVSHATYIVNSDIVIPDCPRHSCFKIRPPELIPVLTMLMPLLLGFMQYSLPSQFQSSSLSLCLLPALKNNTIIVAQPPTNSPLWFLKLFRQLTKKLFILADHSFTMITTIINNNWHA